LVTLYARRAKEEWVSTRHAATKYKTEQIPIAHEHTSK
jgi:hypothetical protein